MVYCEVSRVTDDFHPMIDAVNSTVVELAEYVGALPELREELEEVQAFLRWIRDGAFVFLGYREYDIVELDRGPAIVVQPGSGLGVLRSEAESQFAEPVLVSEADPGIMDLVMGGPHLIITKTNHCEDDDDPVARYAFFIEGAEAMAERLGALYLEIQRAYRRNFGAAEAVRVSVFQYMVGNTDWSMVRFHNTEVLQNSEGVYVPVPHDFDWTGFVAARYARPDDRLGIRNVRERIYRGFCRPNFDASTVYAQFVEIRVALEALYTGQEGLEEGNGRDAVAYLDDFYEDIESPQRARRRLERDRRNM